MLKSLKVEPAKSKMFWPWEGGEKSQTKLDVLNSWMDDHLLSRLRVNLEDLYVVNLIMARVLKTGKKCS